MRHKFPARWKLQKLDRLGFVGRGRSRHRPRNEPSLYGGQYPFFQTGDIKAANLYLTEYSQTYNEKGLTQSKLWEAGTLCITIAANIADTAILGIRGCFPDSVIGFIPDPVKADVKFIKYYIDLIKLDMQQVSHGTTQDNLSLDKLLRFDFVVPELEEQQKIAAILSAYDDLIENNRRRINILEEMAQNLYREWFVKFRFPGHEKVRMVDSPLGEIPEGWGVASIDDVAIVYRGRSYRSKDLLDEGGLPFINLKCVDRDGGFRRNGLKRYEGKYKETQKVVTGDIVMAVTDMTQERRIVARAGRVPTLDTDFGVISMDLVKIEPKDGISPDFLYGYFRGSDFADNVKQHANGANVLHLSPDRIKEYQFALPPEDVRERFTSFSTMVFQQIENLNRRNETLRQTRDLLLPKLISGELDVSELDIEISGDNGDPTDSTQPPKEEQTGSAAAQSTVADTVEITKPEDQGGVTATISRLSIDESDTDEIMAVFRKTARSVGTTDRDELIRGVAHALGYKRVGTRIEETLRGHLRAAIRRKIIGTNGAEVWLNTPRMEDYEREQLIEFFASIMRKGKVYARDDVIRNLASHVGFQRLRESVVAPIKSAINSAIRRGIILKERNSLWRQG